MRLLKAIGIAVAILLAAAVGTAFLLGSALVLGKYVHVVLFPLPFLVFLVCLIAVAVYDGDTP